MEPVSAVTLHQDKPTQTEPFPSQPSRVVKKTVMLLTRLFLLLVAIGLVLLTRGTEHTSKSPTLGKTGNLSTQPIPMSQSNQEILVADYHKIVTINPFNTKQNKILLTVHNGTLFDASWSPDHSRIVYRKSCTKPCTMELDLLQNASSEKIVSTANKLNPYDDPPILTFAWVDSDHLHYTLGQSTYSYTLSTQKKTELTQEPVSTLTSIPPRSSAVATSPDGTINVVTSNNSSAILKNSKTKVQKTLGNYPCSGYTVQFSPDSSRVAIVSGCGDGGETELFDANGNKLTTFPSDEENQIIGRAHALNGGQITFSSDSSLIFYLGFGTTSSTKGMFVTNYGFLTDKNGQHPKRIDVSILGGTQEISSAGNIVAFSW